MTKIFYERDASIGELDGVDVAVVGYGGRGVGRVGHGGQSLSPPSLPTKWSSGQPLCRQRRRSAAT